MGKKIYLALISLLAFSIIFAEENEAEVIDQATQEEIKAFDLPEGIDLRIEMLKEAILERIAYGEEAINKTLEFNSSIDVSSLNAIIQELKTLSDEVDSIDKENVTQAIIDFVSIKKDAIELISEFRTTIFGILNEQVRMQIKEQIMQRVNERIADAVQRVAQARIVYRNAFSRRIMNNLGYNNTELIEQFKNGTITSMQFREELKNYYTSLDNETRMEIRESLVQSREELRDKAILRVQNAVQIVLNNTINRLNDRAERMNELNISTVWIQSRINITQTIRTKIANAIAQRLNGVDAE
ncbi:MAG: hypothetical protein WC393_04130 [Candidatus Nanoarchaeia archaeon]|jgi:hypothetical protein